MKKLTDEELVIEYLKGDKNAIDTLVLRYLKPIFNFTYRYLNNSDNAEDITQKVFIKAWENLKKFDARKKFKTWMFAIAKNSCVDFLRKKKEIPFFKFENRKGENELLNTYEDESPLPNDLLKQKDQVNELSSAIHSLPIKYRMVLFLRYNDHFTFQEIADCLEVSIETIKSQHRRAIIKLKELLHQNSDF